MRREARGATPRSGEIKMLLSRPRQHLGDQPTPPPPTDKEGPPRNALRPRRSPTPLRLTKAPAPLRILASPKSASWLGGAGATSSGAQPIPSGVPGGRAGAPGRRAAENAGLHTLAGAPAALCQGVLPASLLPPCPCTPAAALAWPSPPLQARRRPCAPALPSFNGKRARQPP